MRKISIVILLFHCLLHCGNGKNLTFTCLPREMKALLKLRESFVDSSNKLSSWNAKNCCTWQGVTCDNITGNVIKLDLNSNRLVSKQLDSSLLELKDLRYLDLSWNDFQLSPIPAFLGSMKQLQQLNLSSSNFGGVVPHHLGNLSSLRILDLGAWPGTLSIDNLMWASNLSLLEHLDVNYVNLSQTKDLVQVLNMLPSIVVLHMAFAGLDNMHLPHACVNSSFLANVQNLDLGANSFGGEFPCFLHNMTSLRVIDLSYNKYNSSDAHFLRTRNLVDLNLEGNLLHHDVDWISEFLWDKCNLKSLNLRQNEFYGEISGLFKNLSRCWNHKLEILDLQDNTFYGHLPQDMGEFVELRALRHLLLSRNQLSGEIPVSLGQLSNLEVIDLSLNSLNATLVEAHFACLSKLRMLCLNSLQVNFSVGLDWVPPFQLEVLSLQSSKFGSVPKWLQTQKALRYLDMSNCNISGNLSQWLPHFTNLIGLNLLNNHIGGPIPDLLCEMRALRVLDLSKNNLSGNLPDCWSNLQKLKVMRLSSNRLSGFIPNSIGGAYSLRMLHLDNNNLTGELPSTLKNCTELIVLDAGDNKLNGMLPEWIGKCLLDLEFLMLRNNEFNGQIPFTFCRLSKLQEMCLANNKLTGKIPPCFGNFIGMVRGRDYNEVLSIELQRETLHQVMKGMELEYTRNLMYVVNLDLSSNYLDGEIPLELTNLSSLVGLNLSHNHLIGKIPEKIGKLTVLESLDLSSNNLSGTIPNSLSDLSLLAYLNLSHNNLFGKIPTGNQLQTLDNSLIYDGNPGLCGAPLQKNCHDDRGSKSLNAENKETLIDDGDRFEKVVFYGVVTSGFAIGFWGIIGFLVFIKGSYFLHIEVVVDKILGS